MSFLLAQRWSLAAQIRGSSLVARLVLPVLLVCAGYYAGGLIGLSVRFPPSGISIIWPPNAILLAALLLSPPRTWGWYLLAALPTPLHLVANFQPGVPPLVMLTQFAGNAIQAVLNLVMNSIEAMSGVDDRSRELTVQSRRAEAGSIVVAVCDSGPGLGAGDPDLIFNAFYTTKASGMGMGLSVSRSIVEAHGGRLWATSQESGGAKLQFSLPTTCVVR